MFDTEIVVIGEVTGRWNSRIADEREHAFVSRTLSEVASESGWQFVDYDGLPHAVKSENVLRRSVESAGQTGHSDRPSDRIE